MAYTKYSLTPANNTATPPDGAPEGMLPSAVNDTMRDMMAQIRDCGDGIRDGTYTMTAPKITGGTITGAAFTGNTFTNPVISGGSINNTPIGATTANTGAFTTLSATGVTTVQAGTVSAPAITTTGDTNTGIYFPAADTIAFTEGGVEAMRIDSSGQLGIGTNAPTRTLDVLGTQSFRDVTGAKQLLIANDSTLVRLFSRNASDNSDIPMGFYTGATERMRIDSSGNVCVGTTSSFGKMQINISDTSTTILNTTNLYLSNSGAATTNQRVDLAFRWQDGTYNGNSAISVIRESGTARLASIAFCPSNSSGDPTERMRITSGGDLLVGTTTSSGKLSVNGNAYIDTYLGIGAAPTSSSMINMSVPLNVPRSGIRILSSQSPASGSFIEFLNLSGNVAGSITHTGTTTVAYNTSSDYRLKENIAPMVGALAKVQALKPCTYIWKEDGTDGEGFIAHELAEVCPQAVTFEKDAVDAEGNPKYQGVDTSFLVATLTAAIQELNAKVEAQAAEIALLKSK